MATEPVVLIGLKQCALPKCGKEFAPSVSWQKCCSVDHAKKLRWQRRRERISKALRIADALRKDGIVP